VLKSTQTEAGEFKTILEPLQGWVEFAATGTGNSGAIVPALQSFFQVQGDGLEAMGTRVTAAITGAVNATKAYIEGDLEMVQTYQTNAAAAANPNIVRPGDRNIPR
jgi:hypothetical protein